MHFIPALINNWLLSEKTTKAGRRPAEDDNMGDEFCPTLTEYDGFGLDVNVEVPLATNNTNRWHAISIIHGMLVSEGAWWALFQTVIKKGYPICWWIGRLDFKYLGKTLSYIEVLSFTTYHLRSLQMGLHFR